MKALESYILKASFPQDIIDEELDSNDLYGNSRLARRSHLASKSIFTVTCITSRRKQSVVIFEFDNY